MGNPDFFLTPFSLPDKAQTTETLAPYNPTGRARKTKQNKTKNNQKTSQVNTLTRT